MFYFQLRQLQFCDSNWDKMVQYLLLRNKDLISQLSIIFNTLSKSQSSKELI